MEDLWQTMVRSLSIYWQSTLRINAGAVLGSLVAALLVALLTLVAARLARDALTRALSRTKADPNAALLVGRVVYWAILALGAGWVLTIFGVEWTALVATFGVLGLAAGLALQDVLRNLVAGLYLLMERPFRIGDHIVLKDHQGQVTDVRLRTTHLHTPDDREVIIPNITVFAEIIVNRSTYTRPNRGAREDNSAGIQP
ncbi:MAG: mechanosensitive ion channel domain-containing protein [Chloroflexota bacterium]